MIDKESNFKKPALIAFAALIALLIGAFVFWQERMFADVSYYAFNIINNDSLNVLHGRYGSFITQLIPYWLQKLNMPVKTILIGYSISFNLFYLLVSAILIFLYKQYRLAILMALYYFLFVSDTYFFAIDEIHQAVAWMFLMYGTLISLGNKKVNFILLLCLFLPLAFFAVSTHFIAIIPTVFLWVFFILEKKNWPFTNKITLLLSVLLLAVVGLKFILSSSSQAYESAHLYNATHFSLKDIIESFSSPVISEFGTRCLTNYWITTLVFIISIVILCEHKLYKLLAWTILSSLGYIILIGLTYGTFTYFALYHIEAEWQSLGILIAAPFVFTFLPAINKNIVILALSVIFITRLIYIGESVPKFTWRTQFQERVLSHMKQKGITKLAVIMDDVYRPKYLLDWAAGYESMFASSINGDKPQRTFIFVNKDDKKTQEQLTDPKIFYHTWSILPIEWLNKRYFVIDTVQPYTVLSFEQLFTKGDYK